jgi:LTXXQ motif family protein
MRAYDCKVLLCATALILVSAPADARHWRHYGYHWHGHGWTGSRSNSDEPQVEKQLPNTQPLNEPRNQGDFSAAIQEMIDSCDGQVQELRKMPLDGVAKLVNPTEQQRDALEQIRNVALNASEALAPACPKDLPGSVPERLEVLSRALGAMAASLATLRPTFATFYGLLSDEQKARLVAKTASSDAQSRSDEKSRSHISRDVANRHSDSYCQQWVLYLKSWPIRQIDDRASLSDDQRATLYELTAAIYRAAGKLTTKCDADDRFTPPGRLEAREEELKALQQSVEAISPAFSRFEAELTDAQKAQLRGVLNLSNTIGQRSVTQ